MPGVVERHAVVDRAGWAAANIGTFRDLVARLEGSLIADRPADPGFGASFAALANRFITTRQIGFLLGYLGTRVLGQYDVALLSAEARPGRLLFVEENIRGLARQLDVPLADLRTWIALHEATHAFEFEAHAWLRPYLRDRLERQLAGFLEGARAFRVGGLAEVARTWARPNGDLASAFLAPAQRQALRETQVVMSLLEGFSDWVMDDVGADLLADVTGHPGPLRGTPSGAAARPRPHHGPADRARPQARAVPAWRALRLGHRGHRRPVGARPPLVGARMPSRPTPSWTTRPPGPGAMLTRPLA